MSQLNKNALDESRVNELTELQQQLAGKIDELNSLSISLAATLQGKPPELDNSWIEIWNIPSLIWNSCQQLQERKFNLFKWPHHIDIRDYQVELFNQTWTLIVYCAIYGKWNGVDTK